jgi:hypothetical protein
MHLVGSTIYRCKKMLEAEAGGVATHFVDGSV